MQYLLLLVWVLMNSHRINNIFNVNIVLVISIIVFSVVLKVAVQRAYYAQLQMFVNNLANNTIVRFSLCGKRLILCIL